MNSIRVNKARHNMLLLPAVAVLAAVMAACASIGHPEGGPRDTDPPKYIGSNPTPGALGVKRQRVEVVFNENIKVDNPMDRVVVSPAQRTQPSVIASGRKLIVELRDTLRDSTTYTIDFSDAIRDLNEGNILDGFALDFSTGPVRDSLQISGMVFDARNLEPAQGMIVGVYSNLADSAITTLPLERIAKTNQLGEFTLRNLKPGEYRIFALKDMNRDYHWDRSEDVAFYPFTISPQAAPGELADTLVDRSGNDSIVMRYKTMFTPNDILLTWFNENYKPLYLKNHARTDSNRLSLLMGAPLPQLPRLRIVGGELDGVDSQQWARIEYTPSRDSLEYWITDPRVMAVDTLMLAVDYLHTDTLERITWTTDTLKFHHRQARGKKGASNKKKAEVEVESDSLPQIQFLNLRSLGGGAMELNGELVLEADQPIDSVDHSLIRLQTMIDTLWTDVKQQPRLQADTMAIRRLSLTYPWESGGRYRLIIDSLAVTGVYGNFNRPIVNDFTAKTNEDYATLVFNLTGVPDSLNVVVELLNSSDTPVRTANAEGSKARFTFLPPATYYARAFIDANANGQWDTGNLLTRVQPEEVYYYPLKINVKQNWDVEQNWNLLTAPLDTQKPNDIKKNKPKTKEKSPTTTDDEEEDDEMFGNDRGRLGSQYQNNRSGRNSSSGRVNSGLKSTGARNQLAR